MTLKGSNICSPRSRLRREGLKVKINQFFYMRRFDKEITDPGIIHEILNRAEICRIGLTDGDEAYIVPMNFGFEDGILYFHSAPKGRKMELLTKNNRVSFEITYDHEVIKGEAPCQWTARYRSVMGSGTIEILDDPESKKTGLTVIMRKYGASGELEYETASLRKMVILKLHIVRLTAKQSGDW